MSGLIERVLTRQEAAFAMLYRPGAGQADAVDVIAGDIATHRTLADVPLASPESAPGHDTLLLVPYRQIAERGFAVPADDAMLTALRIREHELVAVERLTAALPDVVARTTERGFDISDAEYGELVERIVRDEIGTGKGANFVLKREFVVDIANYTLDHALAFFGRLLRAERGAHWIFLIHTGERTLIGASPERHISLQSGRAVMNPISGTYRYPAGGPTLEGVLGFLADGKETDELYMVLDEELKMMGRLCDGGGRIVGPYLKEMARLAHTEYFIEGDTDRGVQEILRETMFAPTVTGSPLESACRVIAEYEPAGRGYYSGFAALIGRDAAGGHTLDSAILIRTADIDTAGRVAISVGATLVRHSQPAAEAAETRTKAAALLHALGQDAGLSALARHPEVLGALRRRNQGIAEFWLGRRPSGRRLGEPGASVLVIDAEDTFTSMIGHQLAALGLDVTVRRYDEPHALGDHDLVVLGPGPGDPRDESHPKIAFLRSAVRRLRGEGRPFLAVCLSHQVLCAELGLDLVRRDSPNQGVQREIDLFGRRAVVGFYNTFAARAEADRFADVRVSRDPETGEVHALRGPLFASMQFHAESVLTRDGVGILRDAVNSILPGCCAKPLAVPEGAHV